MFQLIILIYSNGNFVNFCRKKIFIENFGPIKIKLFEQIRSQGLKKLWVPSGTPLGTNVIYGPMAPSSVLIIPNKQQPILTIPNMIAPPLSGSPNYAWYLVAPVYRPRHSHYAHYQCHVSDIAADCKIFEVSSITRCDQDKNNKQHIVPSLPGLYYPCLHYRLNFRF